MPISKNIKSTRSSGGSGSKFNATIAQKLLSNGLIGMSVIDTFKVLKGFFPSGNSSVTKSTRDVLRDTVVTLAQKGYSIARLAIDVNHSKASEYIPKSESVYIATLPCNIKSLQKQCSEAGIPIEFLFDVQSGAMQGKFIENRQNFLKKVQIVSTENLQKIAKSEYSVETLPVEK